MHCDGCAAKIKRSVSDLHIDHQIKINVASGKVHVDFDTAETSISKIKDSITQVGFQVEKVEIE